MITQGLSYPFLFVCADANASNTRLSGVPFAAGDCWITKPGGAPAQTTNLPVERGGGRYQLTLTAAETALGLAEGTTGELLLDIAHVGGGFSIVPLLGITVEVQATPPGALTTAERAALAAAVAAAVAAPSAATIAAAVDSTLASYFAGVLAAIAALPPAPSSATVASAVEAILANEFAAVAPAAGAAVAALLVDGDPLLEVLAVLRSALTEKGSFPMTAAGGAFATRNAADTKNRWAGTIDAAGNRTVTTFDGG